MSAIFTKEDANQLFGVVTSPASGFVYYDECTGVIKALSHGPTEMEHPYIMVSPQTIDEFVDGTRDLSKWLVIYQGPQPELAQTHSEVTVHQSSKGWEVVGGYESLVTIVVVIPPDDRLGWVRVETLVDAVPGFTEPFTLRLTKKGSPDEIVTDVVIDPVELFEKKKVAVDYGEIIDYDVDIVTKPLTMVGYRIQQHNDEFLPVPLPKGRFDDFAFFTNEEKDHGLKCVIRPDKLVFSLAGNGGRIYDRNLKSVVIMVCRENDKEALLWSKRIPLVELAAGIEVEMVCDNISVASQLYYLNCFCIDERPYATNN